MVTKRGWITEINIALLSYREENWDRLATYITTSRPTWPYTTILGVPVQPQIHNNGLGYDKGGPTGWGQHGYSPVSIPFFLTTGESNTVGLF